MAGDLEDFLRRAAERRKAKQQQQQQQQPQQQQQQPRQTPPPRQQQQPQRTRPTNRRPQTPVAEEVVVAEVVEDPYATRREKIAEAKRLAEKARQEVARKTKSTKQKVPVAQPVSSAPATTGDLTQDLLNLIRRPGGIQQAILLREILERPEHRW